MVKCVDTVNWHKFGKINYFTLKSFRKTLWKKFMQSSSSALKAC